MLTQIGIKISVMLEEWSTGGNKRGEGNDRREGKWKKGITRNKHFWEGRRLNEGIKHTGEWNRILGNIVSIRKHDYYRSLL